MSSSMGSLNGAALVIFIIALLVLRYNASRNRYNAAKRRDIAKAKPPTVPYVVPLLGTVPLGYIWDPIKFVLDPNNFFKQPHPVHVKILHYDFYVVQGAENIKALFKNSWSCTSTVFVKFALGYAFGLPSKTLALFDNDDSGSSPTPHPDSSVEPRNRIDYLDHQSVSQFLEGKGLPPFWNRFLIDVTRRFQNLHHDLGDHVKSYPDLMRLVGDEATISILNALCGPYLLQLNPTFLDDFWIFDRNLQTYMQGTPWFLAPFAYASRTRVLNAVKTWQDHARNNFTPSSITPDGDDPFWGSAFFRDRQAMYLAMDGFSAQDIASPDFGAIWASRNAITASSWIIFNLYRDPALLEQVRAEVDSCLLSNVEGRVDLDLDALLKLPLLQAVYAETLRLRMHFYIIRMPDRIDLEIGKWSIPRRKVVVTSTTAAHRDSASWPTGMDNEHPVDKFWPGRFLQFSSAESKPVFSTKTFEGSWIPYGGGPRQCPGRHFAKRQILLTAALMVVLFDCEVLPEGKDVGEDLSLSGFGGGVSHPAGKVPVRLRRREPAARVGLNGME